MKTKKIAAFIAALSFLFVGSPTLAQQGSEPTLVTADIIADMTANIDIARQMLSVASPKTQILDVPSDAATGHTGFRIGFGIQPKIDGNPVVLDSIQVTSCGFTLHKLLVTPEGETETAIEVPDSMAPKLYTGEFPQGGAAGIGTTAGTGFKGDISSPIRTPLLGTSVPTVGTIFVSRQAFVWGKIAGLTRPEFNEGYRLKWNLKFIPTHGGKALPEVEVNNITFTYKVGATVQPEFVGVHIDNAQQTRRIRFQGGWVQYASLQVSSDLKRWKSISIVPYAAHVEGTPLTYEWTLTHLDAEGTFFRLVWNEYKTCPDPQLKGTP